MKNIITAKGSLVRLLYAWAIDMGVITAFVVASYWVNHLWMPIMGFLLMLPVFVFGNRNLLLKLPNCSMLNHYTVYIMFFSSVVMLIINFLDSRWVPWYNANSVNPQIPYIASLIVYTVAAVLWGISIVRRGYPEYCRACKSQALGSVQINVESNLFHNEAKYLLHLAFWISFCLAGVSWLYYSLFFINININSPDTFFFFVIPCAVYVLSLVFVFVRFENLRFEVAMTNVHANTSADVKVRFMIIGGDKVLLHEVANTVDGQKLWDTPVVADMAYADFVSELEAVELFKKATGVSDFKIRYLFNTATPTSNVFHFAITLPEPHSDSPVLQGHWFTIYEIDTMIVKGEVVRTFAYEIHRIFTITMAWKTYDREGNRLYPIKNYRPTFRLSDFNNWDVDYNDLHWMSVAKNNEDVRFFKFRRFWRKYVSGIDVLWRKRN